ncbi:MAG: hypothetical protein DCC88_00090 [Spirobacillus cienkowskii]|uniref:Uncharacterized protein n=1 Tax=Spirobacillus cienkowskii TaxID=495820 RepID=A0A369KRQ4_9BACT|nr:MAG: hypothetical protein DCC88_00090 [Spirobacillus cienkowskii]
MSKAALAGIKILEKGEMWRQELLKGSPIFVIAQKYNENLQVVSRAVWLAKIPQDLRQTIKQHPEIFTRNVLINGFAAKRRRCEKENFKLLRTEIERLIFEGSGSKPKLPKKQRKKILVNKKQNLLTNPIVNLERAIEAEYQLKQHLGYHCRVSFTKDENGEIRIFFKNNKELQDIIEMTKPTSPLF